MTTKITDANLGVIANKFINWQSVITADGSTTTNLVAGRGYIIDTTSAAHTVNLPASATKGDTVVIKDYAGTFGTNAVTINRNGNSIQGAANNSELTTNRASVTLVYIDSTKGWLFSDEHNVGNLGPTFISASGGTETTDGDFKIHTFTGDGCFVVSSVGNSVGGSNEVSYLVVAGGGGGGTYFSAGGGGAGGYREGKEPNSPHTASPLATTGSTVSATTYPISIGGGGAGATSSTARGTSGTNSTFNLLTATGGGGGGSFDSPSIQPGLPGGSGGGGGARDVPAGEGTSGSGNTPPVSPPQGNNGGSGSNPGLRGGGGGGASAVGATGLASGNGGAGVSSSISGSPTTYGGGGAGGGFNGTGGTGGPGGGGNGGTGNGTTPATSGTANTGGGGGGFGGGQSGPNTANGGKGIVVIRYKYQ